LTTRFATYDIVLLEVFQLVRSVTLEPRIQPQNYRCSAFHCRWIPLDKYTDSCPLSSYS